MPRHVVPSAAVPTAWKRALTRLGADAGPIGGVGMASLQVALEVADLGEAVLGSTLGAADGADESLFVNTLVLP